ncbi:MAG: CvpA family protein [Alphaproteobacteria bacterium]|nr:CvpA family protein [Alphaproteobacteria bacterium]
MIIDVIVGIVLLISIVISILRGFVRETLTILGIAGGTVAAYIGGPLLSPLIKSWMGIVEDPENSERFLGLVSYSMLAEAIAYVVVFVIFVIIFSLMSHFLAESVKNIGMGAIDRTLGMVFGLVRGVLFLGLLYMPVYYLVGDDQAEDWAWLKASKSRVYLEATSGWIAGFIPSERVEDFTEATQSIETMNDARKKLQEMDILQLEDGLIELQDNVLEGSPAENTSDDNQNSDAEGYTNEFRNKMNQLIEDTTEE